MEKEEFIRTCLLLLYCLLTVANSHSGTYHAGNGIYCNKCHPGTYVNKNCTSKDPTPDCQPCELGKQFQPDWTPATTCAPCSTCDSDTRKEIKENCTTTADIVCQCKAGYYRRSETEEKFVCIEHTKCEEGQGLLRQGDRETNAICESCVNGSTYFDTTQQPCQLCTNCSTEICAPFCLPANPVTTEKTAGLAGYAIALIVLAVVAAVIILVALIACYKKVPCWHEQSSNAASAPHEESRPLSNGTNGSPRMNGRHCTH